MTTPPIPARLSDEQVLKPADISGVRVRITRPTHPHCGASGVYTGQVISLFGSPMAELKFDETRDGVEGCFVEATDVVRERRRKAGSR